MLFFTPWARSGPTRTWRAPLHFVTANCNNRTPAFHNYRCAELFLQAVKEIKKEHPFRLIAYVVMPDHCHLIVNPPDGKITNLTGALKGLSARYIIDAGLAKAFLLEAPAHDGSLHQVWQDSFKTFGPVERLAHLAKDQLYP